MAILDPTYTIDQLRTWIKDSLGARVWRLEGMNSQNEAALDTAVTGALMLYSKEVPRFVWETIPPGTALYTIQSLPIYGVIRVDFIEPFNSYGMGATGFGLTQNLTGVVTPPVLSGGGIGAGDIQQFLTWRKSFQRVTSRRPDYRYDDVAGTIHVYNPVSYHACAIMTAPRKFEQVRLQHKWWLAKTCLAEAKIRLGEIRSKFVVQSPGGKDIDLSGKTLKDEGTTELKDCVIELNGIRMRGIPCWD